MGEVSITMRQCFFAIGVSGVMVMKNTHARRILSRERYYFAKNYVSFVHILKKCLCAAMTMLCQIKNKHSWSNPLVVCWFCLIWFASTTNQKKTSYILCSTISKCDVIIPIVTAMNLQFDIGSQQGSSLIAERFYSYSL